MSSRIMSFAASLASLPFNPFKKKSITTSEIVQPEQPARLTPKQMKPHSEKINKAEFNRARKARKRVRDQQRSIDNNPCLNA